MTARPVGRLAECPCALLDGAAADQVIVDNRPATSIADAGDRALATNVARIALSVHVGTATASGWTVEDDAADARVFNIMVKFPAGTCFTHQQLELVTLVNRLRVRSVWVQPEEDCVYLGAALWRSDVVGGFTVQDVVVVRRVADDDGPAVDAGTGKRARARK